MKKLILLLCVCICGCVEVKSNAEKNIESNIKYIDARYMSLGHGIHIIEYEGNKYIVCKATESITICPALPAKAEK